VVKAVNTTIDSVPITDIDFSTLSPIDVKQIIIGFVESSFKPVEDFLNPLLNVISKYKAAKDKTFPEMMGLTKINKDDNMVTTIPENALKGAMDALKKLSLIPYPAVAALPQSFDKLHPVLTSDDLPPWKRFTLDNFLFVTFLDQFCKQGKKGGGLQENP
jgi:hypothetical protein